MAMKLTGKTRYRPLRRWFRDPLMVLQVEEAGTMPTNMRTHVEMTDRRWWRDARMEDVSIHSEKT